MRDADGDINWKFVILVVCVGLGVAGYLFGWT